MAHGLKRDRREKFWANNKLECVYCSKKVSRKVKSNSPMRATIDHIIPRALGGKSTKDNLVVACFECNNRKSIRENDQVRYERKTLSTS